MVRLTFVQKIEGIAEYARRGTFNAHDKAALERNLELSLNEARTFEPVILAARKALADEAAAAVPSGELPGPQEPNFYDRIKFSTAAYGAWAQQWLAAHGLTTTFEPQAVIDIATPDELRVLAAGLGGTLGSPAAPVKGVDYGYYTGVTVGPNTDPGPDGAVHPFVYLAYRNGVEVARAVVEPGFEVGPFVAAHGIDPN